MNLISKWLNLFKPVTLEEDAEEQAKLAVEDIAQSESTILRAQYIKHMAEWKLKAIADWSNKQGNTNHV